MPLILTILILFFQTVNAEEIKFGTYSLATEAGWTAWFELKPNNSAMISPAYDTEDLDPAVAKASKPTPIKGSWKKTPNGIDLTYGLVTDSFQFEERCKDWQIHPCFNFVSSKASGKEKTILKYEQPYINWNIKLNPPKELSKSELDKCKKECAELQATKQLKDGMDEKSCITQTCKPIIK